MMGFRFEQILSFKVGFVYLIVVAVTFFIIGTFWPSLETNQLKSQIQQANERTRLFANEVSKRSQYVVDLRTQTNFDQNLIEVLDNRLQTISEENEAIKKKLAFYQHLLKDRNVYSDKVEVELLSINLLKDQWRIEAGLIFTEKLSSSYYFEFDIIEGANKKTLRYPKQGYRYLASSYYQAIDEIIQLPLTARIENLSLIVVDENNQVLTSAQIKVN